LGPPIKEREEYEQGNSPEKGRERALERERSEKGHKKKKS